LIIVKSVNKLPVSLEREEFNRFYLEPVNPYRQNEEVNAMKAYAKLVNNGMEAFDAVNDLHRQG